MAYYEGEVGGSGMGMGGLGEGWWGIILIALLFGWGNNRGFGNSGYGNNSGAFEGYTLASDFATLQRQLDSGFNGLERKGDYIQEQLCDGFLNISNSFANTNNAIMQNGYETRNAISNLGYNMQQCCCDTQRSIDGLKYDMSVNNCNVLNTVNNGFNSVINNQNKLYADFLAYDNAKEIANLRATNASLSNQLSQANQTSQIINTIVESVRPTAKPAYITCNPYASSMGSCGCSGGAIQ